MKALRIQTIGWVVFAWACAAKPSPKEETMQNKEPEPAVPSSTSAEPGVVPQWREGDAWEVHYRIRVPNPAKSANPPPRYEEHDWRYTVGDSKAGDVHVSARWSGDAPELWRMVFAASGKLIRLHPPTAAGGVVADGPFVVAGFNPADKLTSAWPKFPLQAGPLEAFEDGALTQQVTTNGDAFEVTIVRRAEEHGVPVERTVTQTWELGRPWWSSVTVQSRSTYKGETFEVLEVEGRVTSWPARGEP